jgi:hypothetical protein
LEAFARSRTCFQHIATIALHLHRHYHHTYRIIVYRISSK